MTISSQTRQAGPYLGNGVTTSLPFGFKVFSAADVQVVRTDTAGAESVLLLATHYTVTLNSDQNANPGGSVVLLAAPAVGVRTTITSALAALQPTDLTNQGGFYPRVISDALDRLTILIQQILNRLARTISLPISDTTLGSTTLPTSSARADQLLGFDTSGNFRVYPLAQGPTVIAAQVAVADAAGNFPVDNVEAALAEVGAKLRGSDVSTPGNYIASGTGLGGLRTNTADGTDNRGAYLAGGGAVDNARGAYVLAFGNEHATNPGALEMVPGLNGRTDIRDGAGAVAWRVLADGVRTNPSNSQHYWSRLSGGTTQVERTTTGSYLAVAGPTQFSANSASSFNPTTGLITAPVRGLYFISMEGRVLGNGNATLGNALRINGSNFCFRNSSFSSSGEYLTSVSTMFFLEAGDTVAPWCEIGVGGSFARGDMWAFSMALIA